MPNELAEKTNPVSELCHATNTKISEQFTIEQQVEFLEAIKRRVGDNIEQAGKEADEKLCYAQEIKKRFVSIVGDK